MFERFTDRARKTMAVANQESQRLLNEYIAPEHILLGLVKAIRSEGGAGGVAAHVLRNYDVNLDEVRTRVMQRIKPGNVPTQGKLPQTPTAKKVIENAILEARNLNHSYVGDEHLLLGLVLDSGVAGIVLRELGLQVDGVREETLDFLGGDEETDSQKEANSVELLRSTPIAIAGDPSILSPEDYAELVTILGDIARANGGKGVERVWEMESDLPIDAEVPV